MKIRAYLMLLVGVAFLPLLIISLIGGVFIVKNERELYRNEAVGRVRAAMSAIDAEMRGHVSTLQALATSKNLEIGDIRAFHAESRRVFESRQPNWLNIGLATVNRVQLMDAIRAFGEHVPFRAYDETFDRALRTRAPVVGVLTAGPAVPTPSIPVRVPVIVNGEVRYVLSAPIDPASIGPLLAAQKLPAEWRISVADSNKKIITRIPSLPVGSPISAAFAEQLALAPEGWYRGISRNGDARYAAYVTSSTTGWVMGIAIPADSMDAAIWHTVRFLMFGVLLALGVSWSLAALIARRIEQPIRELAATAESVKGGLPIAMPATRRIHEIAHLHDVLYASGLVIEERDKQLENERQRLRERAELLDLAHDAISVRSRSGVIKFWSSGAEEIYGWTRSEAIGRVAHDLLQTQFPTSLSAIGAELERNGRWDGTLANKRKDGSMVTVMSRCAMRPERAGAPAVVLEIDSDLTAELRAQESIARLNEQLREENRQKDRFLATLAHELRNPLAPIRNCVSVLKAPGAPAADVAWAHKVIERQVTQMSRLLDDLLDVSRITHGKLELKFERVSLQRAIDAAIESCQPLLVAHRLILEVESRPVEIQVDPVRFEQIVCNLVNNAAKYSNDGTRIWLRAHAVGNDLIVVVRDEGIGIDSEVLPRIFEVFVQASGNAGRAKGGMGIGLALVRALVQLHGGSIEAKSEGAERGSEFVVRLAGAVIAETPAAPQAHAHVGARIPPTRFVVADDLADSADSLAAILRLEGHNVTVAYDGDQAFAAVRAEKPRVAVLDLGMPGSDGYDVARRIRAEAWGRDMLLIALSGWGQREDRQRTHSAGFDYHLVKPVALGELNELLKTALGEPAPVVTLIKKDVA